MNERNKSKLEMKMDEFGKAVIEGRIEELERWALCADLSQEDLDELAALKRMEWLEASKVTA